MKSILITEQILEKLSTGEMELKGESDRAAALVGGSIIESQLKDLLTKVLVSDLSKEELDSLFETDRPLHSFSAKIRLVRGLGLLAKDVCVDLDLFRKIRNRFAHEYESLSFESQIIASWVSSLGCLYVLKGQLESYKKTDPERWSALQQINLNKRKEFEIAFHWLSFFVDTRLQSAKQSSSLPEEYRQWRATKN
jgi:DNA-binding MltR family transcriptional regulator